MQITIAIPFYNAEKFLADAIRSVFAQTFKDWELILIDDGSTDRSLEIAASVKDSRVRVISDGQNKKLAARLNEVTLLAQHDLIARMDADDLMCPARLEIQHDFLLNNPEIDLVSTGLYSILEDGTLVGCRGKAECAISFNDLIKQKKLIVHAGILARKSWYERNKYNEMLPQAQDADLWLRASKNCDLNINTMLSPLYIYREQMNITPGKLLKAYSIEKEVLSQYIDNVLMRGIYVGNSCIKSLLVKILYQFGCLSYLQRRRNSIPLNTSQVNAYYRMLSEIKSTAVPGFRDLVSNNR